MFAQYLVEEFCEHRSKRNAADANGLRHTDSNALSPNLLKGGSGVLNVSKTKNVLFTGIAKNSFIPFFWLIQQSPLDLPSTL